MTTHNFQRAHKMNTFFVGIKKTMNQSKRSKLSNLLFSICIGVIFLSSILNLLSTSSIVAAEETQPHLLKEHPSATESGKNSSNNLPERNNLTLGIGSNESDGDLTVAAGETRYLDEVRTNLANTTVLTGELQLPVIDSTGFAAGQEILILVMNGEMIGQFETAVIDTVTSTTLVLATGLAHAYDGISAPVLVQKIPNYADVIVEDNGMLTVNSWDGNTGGVLFFRAQTLTVDPNGQVSANYQGFPMRTGPGTPSVPTFGAAHGGSSTANFFAFLSIFPKPYGNPYQPIALGSGGGHIYDYPDGAGGGIIYIDVNNFTLNGLLSANGQEGFDQIYGNMQRETVGSGGSGGSAWIDANVIAGTGTIQANGGPGGYDRYFCPGSTCINFADGGAGGRIALYANTDTFSSRADALQAYGGNNPDHGLGASDDGAPGTVYINTPTTPNQLRIANPNRIKTDANKAAFLPINSYSFDLLSMNQNGHLVVSGTLNAPALDGDKSAILTAQGLLTTANEITFEHINIIAQDEFFVPNPLLIDGVHLNVPGQLINVNDISITGNGRLSIFPHSYPSGTAVFNQVDVLSGTLTLASDKTNLVGFTMQATDITITADGVVEANGFGYETFGSHSQGSSHGGVGGGGLPPYGSAYEPDMLGSGGGGGAIHLIIDNLLWLDGSLEATDPDPGSGSGGSIWVETDILSGTGRIQADGGDGSGAGGRIAIYAQSDQFSNNNANALTANGKNGAQPGTIYIHGNLDPVQSTLVAQPSLVPTHETVFLTMTLVTRDATPMAGKPVSLSVNSTASPNLVNSQGQPIIAVNGYYPLGLTNSDGVITATLSSAEVAVFELIPWQDNIRAATPVQVSVEAHQPSGTESTFGVISSANVPADGVTAARLRVTARDQFGNRLSGLTATLAASDPNIMVTAVSTATNSQGLIDFVVTHNVPSTAVFTATISDNETTVSLEQTAVVNFIGTDLQIVGNNLLNQQAAGLEVPLALIARNEGYLPAESVVVTTILPPELIFSGPTSSDVTYDDTNHQVIWTVGNLGANSNTALTLQTTLDMAAPVNQSITTTVVASTSSTELLVDNNSFTHTLLVVAPSPHVVITPASSKHYLEVNQTSLHTLTVANLGSAAAQGLNLETHYNWMTVTAPSLPQTLAINEAQDWILELNTNGVTDGRYLDNIEIDGSNVPTQTIPTTIHVGDYAQNVTVNISNTADAAVKNATISLVRDTTRDVYINNVFEESEPVQVSGKTNIKGELLVPYLAAGTYTMTVTAEKHDPFVAIVSVDENTSQLGAQLVAYPSLEFVTKHRELSVLAGGSAEYQLVVRNNGPGHAEGFTLQTPGNLSWLAAALPAGIDRLAANEEMVVTILLNPEVDQALNSYLTEPIIIDASNADPDQVQLTIHVTTIDVGFLAFRVKDQSGVPIEDAKVTIISQEERVVNGTGGAQSVTRDWYTAISDSNGDVVFNDLALTDYSYFVESNGFYIEEGVQAAQPVPVDAQALTSKPGLFKPADIPHVTVRSNSFVDALVELFLNRKPFSVSWEVEPVTINDTYAFTVEVTYEATENVAGLFISHETFCTPPDSPGSDNEDWLIVNTGPVTMTDIVLNPSYNPIWPIPFDVLQWDVAGERISGNWEDGRFLVAEELAPGASITVPFTVTARVPGTDIHGGNAWLAVEGQYELENGEIADYKVNNLGNLKHCQGGQETEMVWTIQQNGSIVGVGSGSQLPDMGDGPPAVPVNTDVALLMQIGEATLERQGFMGTLILEPDANTYLEDVMISINIYDADTGENITNQFVIGPESPTELGSILYEAEQEWLMVPGDLGITQTKGADYNVTARIDYTVNENERSYTTQPATIRIYPPPKINLDYTYSQPQEDGSFYIEVEAENEGFGPAKNLVLDLSELFMDKIDSYGDIDNNDRSLVFELMETTVGGDPQPLNGFEFDFGTIAPSTTITGRWTISVTASDGAYMKDAVITKFSVKCRHLPYKGLQLSSLINCDDHNDFIYVENPYFFCLFERQRVLGGPINTTTGNYSYVQNGFSLPTLGDPLQLNWAYNSLNVGAFPDKPPTDSPLGVGWSYDHNMWLDLQASNVITLHTDTGTAVRIDRNGDILTPADEKFCADMTVEDAGNGHSLYTLHSDNQTTFVFSDTGKLISRTDAQGNDIFFTYEENSENISRVADPVSGQSLDFTYDETTGRLELVTEVTGRTIDFVYDATTGMLSSVLDARGQEWRYEYTQLAGGQDVMYRVLDPDQRLVEETGFDEFGRAITQTYNGRSLTITYDGQRRIVNDGNGGETVLFYNRKDLLVGERNALGDSERYAFDLNQNRIWNENESAVAMNVENNPAGYKTFVENALGQSFHFEYDDHNNMTYMQDALGNEAFYTYNEFNKPISITNFLGDQLYYTYNNNGQKTSILDENGYLTQYGYDDLGRQTVVTNALGYTTYTTYDDAWRIISSTDALGKVTSYSYDAADNLLQKTENVWEGQPQNYLDEYNIVTEYGYDGRGNQTHMTDTLGFVTRSFYGAGNVLEGEIVNWQGTITDLSACQFPPAEVDKDLCTVYEYDNEENLIGTTDPLGRQSRTFYDSLNRLIGTINNWDGVMTPETCQFPPLLADQNLCTLYQYDEVGNQVLMTDTVGHQTYTFYNDVNREVGKISNWQGAIHDLSACQFPPVEVDKDLCTLNQHDEKGQIIITTDPLGRQTRIFYDALGRKIGEVANWQPGFTLGDCVLSPDNLSQTNVCTLYQYDKVGNQTVMTNALGQKTLTVYDALNRTVATVANWDGINEVNDPADCDTLPSTADQNVCSTISYDALGRILQTTDALGSSSSLAYDSLGRIVTTTRYLSNTSVETVKSYDALGRIKSIRDARGHVTNHTYDDLGRTLTATSPEGVVTTQTYDAVGRLLRTTDGLLHTTQQEYDDLNRPVRMSNAEGDVTEREYDALGNMIALIDSEGVRTEHEYDALNRLTAVVENAGGTTANSSNIRTEYTYDALGNQLTTVSDRILDDGQTEMEVTEYDQLNRPVRIIDELERSTEKTYDALGNTRVLTDANGEVTLFTYDGLNRTISVNYVADGQTVAYTYDALGNPRLMTDDLGSTHYDYDDLYRLIEVVNPFDNGCVSNELKNS